MGREPGWSRGRWLAGQSVAPWASHHARSGAGPGLAQGARAGRISRRRFPQQLHPPSPSRPRHGTTAGVLRQLVRVPPAAEVRFVRAVEADPDTFAAPEGTVAVGSVPFDAAPPSAQPVIADPGLQGLWRTIIPDSSSLLRSGDIALVPGLPVTQMRVQPGAGSSSVTAVDQVLESGDVIRTIAGPATRVGSLVDEDTTDGTDSATDRSGGLMTVTIRQGDRMVAVTGPSQALGSLLSRVNVKRRRY